MFHSFLDHYQFLVPVAVRLAALLFHSSVHHAFCRLSEKAIHFGVHHVAILRLGSRVCKFLPDALMIVALLVLQMATESHEGVSNSHE